MSIFRRNQHQRLSGKKVRYAIISCGQVRAHTVPNYIYDPRGGSTVRENYAVDALLCRFGAAMDKLASRELAYEQTQSILAQAMTLPAAWAQRQALSDAWDRVATDVRLALPELDADEVDEVELVAEARAAYERSAGAVAALVASITERVISAEQALAAQRLAKATTKAVYDRAAEATIESIGGREPAVSDAAAAALAAAGIGTRDITWTRSLTEQAHALTEAANELGRHAGLDASDFTLPPSELATIANS